MIGLLCVLAGGILAAVYGEKFVENWLEKLMNKVMTKLLIQLLILTLVITLTFQFMIGLLSYFMDFNYFDGIFILVAACVGILACYTSNNRNTSIEINVDNVAPLFSLMLLLAFPIVSGCLLLIYILFLLAAIISVSFSEFLYHAVAYILYIAASLISYQPFLSALIIGAASVGIMTYHNSRYRNDPNLTKSINFARDLLAAILLIASACLYVSCLLTSSTTFHMVYSICKCLYHALLFILYTAASLIFIAHFCNYDEYHYNQSFLSVPSTPYILYAGTTLILLYFR